MALTPGTRLGPYEVTAQIGAGGMGEVYRAHDTKLGRDVALKILPDSFAHDPDRLVRFEREARALAALNHPHIGAIYGFEEAGGIHALVLELVEGKTLAQTLVRALPNDVALNVARQIADALEAAHEKGIIHRDLKPANVILQGASGPPSSARMFHDVNVKVLDFGLAKMYGEETRSDLSQSPTINVGATHHGVILGTAAYMSPEQARGHVVDKRTDIWAFGCVVYEMLAGRPAFHGDTASDMIAAILGRDPEWDALPKSTPRRVRDLLRRCLAKDAKRRVHDIADVRIEIEEAEGEPQTSAESTPSASRRMERLAWVAAVALLTLTAAAAIVWHRPAPPVPETRLEIVTPPTTDPVSLAISPDGRMIVFVATSEGMPRLWVRSLDANSARPLAGTESAYYPFWSPDARSIGFFAGGRLKRIDIDAGTVQNLANATAGRSGAWNNDGTIFFAPQAGPVFRIPAAGGERAPLAAFAAPPGNGRFPQLLPDGRHFLYYAIGAPEVRGIYVGQLDGTENRRLLDADAGAVYAVQGQLLFVRQGTLFAQRFDPARLELAGNPFPMASNIAIGEGFIAALSASASGPIVYRTGSAGDERQLAWFDRSGQELGKVGDREAASYGPSMSPDGRSVALTRTVDGNTDIWVLEIQRGVLRRFTSDAARDTYPIWSPDGSRIVFTSDRADRPGLYQKPASGAGIEEPLLATATASIDDWSRTGRFLLFRTQDSKTRYDLWALRLDGHSKPFSVAQTDSDDRSGQFSPDGQWIAYESDESGRFEIYVQLFPGPGPKWPISTNGGAQVRWSPDGKELFYVALDGRLMAVSIQLDANHQAVEPRAPVALFPAHVGRAVSVFRQQYMLSPDGQRFLISTLAEEASTSPITIIQNWKPLQQ